VAPPSIIKKHQYVYEVPLSEMLPIPRLLIEKDLSVCNAQAENEPVSYEGDRRHKTFKVPKYHGKKADCIRQILSRDLQVGERNNNLFILYNLLLQNKNTKDYSKKLVIEKNRSLSKPLTEPDLKKIFWGAGLFKNLDISRWHITENGIRKIKQTSKMDS